MSLKWLWNEFEAIGYILVGAGILIVGGLISDFFIGIGDRLFGKSNGQPPGSD